MPVRRAFQQLDAGLVAERLKHGASIEYARFATRALTVAHRIPSALGPPRAVRRKSDRGSGAVIAVTSERAPSVLPKSPRRCALVKWLARP